jgi:AraC family transcriptional regulator
MTTMTLPGIDPGLYVKIVTLGPGRHTDVLPPALEPAVAWVATGEAMVEVRPSGGLTRTATLKQGDFYLSAAPIPIEVIWKNAANAPLTAMHVSIPFPLLHAVRHLIDAAPLGGLLRDALGERDDILSSLLGLVYKSMEGNAGNCTGFMQGVLQALASHVVRHYRSPGPGLVAVRGGLSPHKLHRVLEAMRKNLENPFDLEWLADKAGLSVYHFSRAFKRSTGVTPSRYFVNLRIDEAKRMLHDSRHGVIDVAFAVGYRSPSHFSQVFRTLTGLSPSAYRNRQ